MKNRYWLVIVGIALFSGAMAHKGYRSMIAWEMEKKEKALKKMMIMEDEGPSGDTYLIHELPETLAKRPVIDCRSFTAEDTAVILVFGQSNAANTAETRYTPTHEVYNFTSYDSKCYRARDPLMGAMIGGSFWGYGGGGSVWSRLADMLIEHGSYKKVLLVPVAYVNTSVKQWTVGGRIHPILLETIAKVQAQGLHFTMLLWHQGESDAQMPGHYVEAFEAMLKSLREHGVDAPVVVARTSICLAHPKGERVRAAQEQLTHLPGVYPGPDTDTLDSVYDRHDGCHFSDAGIQKHARLWYGTLQKNGLISQ